MLTRGEAGNTFTVVFYKNKNYVINPNYLLTTLNIYIYYDVPNHQYTYQKYAWPLFYFSLCRLARLVCPYLWWNCPMSMPAYLLPYEPVFIFTYWRNAKRYVSLTPKFVHTTSEHTFSIAFLNSNIHKLSFLMYGEYPFRSHKYLLSSRLRSAVP